MDGGVAVLCNLQSAIAGLKGLTRYLFVGLSYLSTCVEVRALCNQALRTM